MLKIVCVGPQWRGSNAGALFKAFSRLGNVVDVVDENYYINLNNQFVFNKVLDKLFFYSHCKEFNKAILDSVKQLNPDLVLVYKGAFVFPKTLKQIKQQCPVVNVYPDVSFRTHGKLLPETLPLYDWVFTTKTFGLDDMKKELGIDKVSFLPHGYDPELHRPLGIIGKGMDKYLESDVSFIGTYSSKKEQYLLDIVRVLPHLNIKIWGNGWYRSKEEKLHRYIQYTPIVGDLYAMAIGASKINLAILSEAVGGASSGDLITSRTFHIPASGGFMLHEKNEESVLYYEENKECSFFDSKKELVDKIEYYLSHEEERVAISKRGMERAQCDHSIDKRAEVILKIVHEYFLNS